MTQPYALPLLPNVQAAADWLRQHATALQTDSRQLQAGQAFIAWPGAAHDARVHVEAALQRGATACLAEADGASAFAFAQPQATASNGRDCRNRYQWQNQHSLVVGTGAGTPTCCWRRHGRHAGSRALCGARCSHHRHRPHHARPRSTATPPAHIARARRAHLRDGGFFHRH